ncbi:MAG: polyribonucleotide nucleotidyltransferase [Firmicutes bacterium]|nr:polyribonucleotide nucleotidyltransferase [Bacillota bacterium]
MRREFDFSGRTLVVELDKYAKQANGAVMVRYGETTTVVTATASKQPREGIDFFPLTVDYEERMYSVGKIPGGFIKREGRPTEKAILAARLTDRPLRPLFPDGFRNAVHIVATVMSVDQDNPPEIAAINGASIALSISDIPFAGPVGAVMIGYVDDKLVVNPTQEQREASKLNLIVAGTADAIMMVEAGAHEVSQEIVVDALLLAHQEIQKLVEFQNKLVAEFGKPKMEVTLKAIPEEISKAVEEFAHDELHQALTINDKLARENRIDEIQADFLAQYEEDPEVAPLAKSAFYNFLKSVMRKRILTQQLRPDGRGPEEIRPISSEVAVLPRTHGSGLFTRGQTQVLNACTLGVMGDVQILDGLGLEESKRFIHHYNFPPFSVGEAGFMRGPGRREIGHGALAERALEPMIPSEEDFPYTIRLVSEVLESNGSTSMASVCAGTLAMMDAGVPLKAPVAGIAMGLIKENDDYEILTDIQGMEDFMGDMDFKVAGTRKGITALQMDIKVHGLNREILSRALGQAVAAYNSILDKITAVISEPRAELSPYAPRIIILKISADKIREVIGPGGKTVNKIIEETGVKIDIENDGTIYIASVDQAAGARAKEIIEELVKEVEPGEVYMGKVTRVERYGAFVEVLPGKEGLVHISQLARKRVAKTEDVVKVGDFIEVKVTDIDDKGRINLSHKVLLPPEENEDGQNKKDHK